jgi:Tfp pilus assembly protein PilF
MARCPGLKPGTYVVILIVLAALCAGMPRVGFAQVSKGTPAARAEFERGQAAVTQKQNDVALAAFRKAIEIDPTFFDAHQQFVSQTYQQIGYDKRPEAVAKLRATYGEWVAAQPKNAVLHYFLGTFEENPDKADVHFIRAVELDPKFAQAYQDLSFHAEMRGDNAQARAFLKKAADSAPDDPGYAFYYAFSFDETDLAQWKRLSLALVDRFPTHERAAQALYWLGLRAPTETEKLQYLERLKRDFPAAKFSWSASGMEPLFEAYAKSRPDKAVALAREMTATGPAGDLDRWKALLAIEDALLKARDLVGAKKPGDALAALEALQPPKRASLTQLHLAKANAEHAMGQPQKAYDRLADLVATEPAPDLHAALFAQAKRMNRPPAQVKSDLQARREKQAKPAEEFELENYLDRSKATLQKYRGKVVLLNFWYPG